MARVTSVKSSSDFRRIFASGRRFEGDHMTTFSAPSERAGGRLGLAVRGASRRAVVRNRVRRRLRAAYAAAGGPDVEVDTIVWADLEAAAVDFQELVDDFAASLARSGA